MKPNRPLISGCTLLLTVLCAALVLCALAVAAMDAPARAEQGAASTLHDAAARASRESVCFYLIAKSGVNVNLREDASASAKFIKTLNRSSGVFEYDDAKIEASSGLTWAHVKSVTDSTVVGWVAVKFFDSACDLIALTARAVTATMTATARPTLEATPTRLLIVNIKINGTTRATCVLPCRIDLEPSTP